MNGGNPIRRGRIPSCADFKTARGRITDGRGFDETYRFGQYSKRGYPLEKGHGKYRDMEGKYKGIGEGGKRYPLCG